MSGAAALIYSVFPSFCSRLIADMKRPVELPPESPDPSCWPDTGLHATWIGHSTALLKCDGFTILTDPIFSNRAGVSLGMVTIGVKRLVAPALAAPKLPQVDMVLLSHAHMDHFDIPSLRKLERKQTDVVTASGTSDLLRPERYGKVHELRWGEETRIGPARIKAFQVRHWGRRLRQDSHRGYNGYLVETGKYRIVFAGDTAFTTGFRTLRSARPIDLAIMPIGCYNPWRANHCTPEEAWTMGNDAGAKYFLPVHHGTFTLSREPAGEPIQRLLASARNQTDRIAIRRIGQEFHID
jgi:L-ascorbate metabolism protein UlaG (beta-lactamase superfamily)